MSEHELKWLSQRNDNKMPIWIKKKKKGEKNIPLMSSINFFRPEHELNKGALQQSSFSVWALVEIKR